MIWILTLAQSQIYFFSTFCLILLLWLRSTRKNIEICFFLYFRFTFVRPVARSFRRTKLWKFTTKSSTWTTNRSLAPCATTRPARRPRSLPTTIQFTRSRSLTFVSIAATKQPLNRRWTPTTGSWIIKALRFSTFTQKKNLFEFISVDVNSASFFFLRQILKQNFCESFQQMVHQKSRPHTCDLCGRSFAARAGMENHILLIHEKQMPFTCDRCGKKFKRRPDLNNHIRFD